MKSRSFQLYILALRTLLATLLDNLPRCDYPPCVFFKTSGCDPPWDVTDLHVGFEDDAIDGGEIVLGVDRGGGAIRREAAGGARDLENVG